jgi:NADH-quinone oxidoreductase subunit N
VENAPVPDGSAFSVCGAGMLAAVVLILGMVPSKVFEFAVVAGKQLLP